MSTSGAATDGGPALRLTLTHVRPRTSLILLALLGLLAAAGTTTLTGASLADQDESAGNTATAGALTLGGTPSGTTLVSDVPIRPGAPARDGITTLANDGTVHGLLYARLSVPDDASQPLLEALRVQVVECADAACTATAAKVLPAAGVPDDTAPLAQLRGRIALGALAPGTTRRFRVRVVWPATADDPALYGATTGTGMHLRWSLRTPSPDPATEE